jgi:hypothetical protein
MIKEPGQNCINHYVTLSSIYICIRYPRYQNGEDRGNRGQVCIGCNVVKCSLFNYKERVVLVQWLRRRHYNASQVWVSVMNPPCNCANGECTLWWLCERAQFSTETTPPMTTHMHHYLAHRKSLSCHRYLTIAIAVAITQSTLRALQGWLPLSRLHVRQSPDR